jgi:ABC-2 type transport system ATP-binding protein
VIRADGLEKRYGFKRVLRGVDFDLSRGGFLVVTGPNGAGKTTLLRLCAGLAIPSGGSLEVDADRSLIGFLAHEPLVYRELTALENLDLYGRLYHVPERRERIGMLLERFGLWEQRRERASSLSRGQLQRLALCRSLLHKPELLILDEPFSGLDPVNAEVLKDAILDVRRQGTTIVFSTHDMAVAERMCDRICMIFRGRKVLDGTLDEIQSEYGTDTVRVKVDGPIDVLKSLPGVTGVNDYGQLQELRFAGNPQALLSALVARVPVRHFEVSRPSLHDIFVRIARPTSEELQEASHG